MTLYRTELGYVFNSETGAVTQLPDDPELRAWRDTLPLYAPSALLAPTPAAPPPAPTPKDVGTQPAAARPPRPYDLLEADCLANCHVHSNIEYLGVYSGIWYPATVTAVTEVLGKRVRIQCGKQTAYEVPGPAMGDTPAVRWVRSPTCAPWVHVLKPGDVFEARFEAVDLTDEALRDAPHDGEWYRARLVHVEVRFGVAEGLRFTTDSYDPNAPQFWLPFGRCRPVKPAEDAPVWLAKCPEWTRELKKGAVFLADRGDGPAAVVFQEHRVVDGTPRGLTYSDPDADGNDRDVWYTSPFVSCSPRPESVPAKPAAPDPRDAEITRLELRVNVLEDALREIRQVVNQAKP